MDLLNFSRKVRITTDENFFAMAQFGMSRGLRDKLVSLNEEFYTALKNRMRAAKLSGSVKTDRGSKIMELERDFNNLRQKAIFVMEMKLEEYNNLKVPNFMDQFQ